MSGKGDPAPLTGADRKDDRPMITRILHKITHSLISRLILLVGLVLSVCMFTWAYFTIDYQKKDKIETIAESCDRLGNTIKLGTHYAMMLNSRGDINEITKNVSRQEGIEHVRIFNKEGQIKFSNDPLEVDRITTIKADACYICHKKEPPLEELSLSERTRIFNSAGGYRLLGIISPIYNEPSCSTDACHVHPQDKRVLGALDVVVSLKETDQSINSFERWMSVLAIFSFVGTSAIIATFLLMFVNRPIKRLITLTRLIGQGMYDHKIATRWDDEIGQLAGAINSMERKIQEKQEELNRQKIEYQELFEQVPCYITVQDSNFRLLRYNREFSRQFAPRPGGFCYEVYKGRSERCPVCPVVKTFEDGESHLSEEYGVRKDGTLSAWICRTSPLRDDQGRITAVMEMSIDVTERKQLEEEIKKSEKKYRHIFNNIPNPIFVLDLKDLRILDCNESVKSVYGYDKEDIVGRCFTELFTGAGENDAATQIKTLDTMNQVRQATRDGRIIYVNIRVSPSEYLGRDALLVTTSDITKRLMAEQQLIQGSKMATLGEMATGIAHELNQPLSVIKTASSFLIKKVTKREPIKEEILQTMAEEIDAHVDRASRIINHLREFGRKSDVKKEEVQVNDAIISALDLFSQQLKLRGIRVELHLQPDLPRVLGDANRLEQVFVNLLINARDAIEEKGEKLGHKAIEKKISLITATEGDQVVIEVRDTGTGIPKAILDKVYEPFFTSKRVGKGTGLGLSISYGIVQDYDGTIRVETEENEGANFIIRFPIYKDGR